MLFLCTFSDFLENSAGTVQIALMSNLSCSYTVFKSFSIGWGRGIQSLVWSKDLIGGECIALNDIVEYVTLNNIAVPTMFSKDVSIE